MCIELQAAVMRFVAFVTVFTVLITDFGFKKLYLLLMS